MAYAAVSVGPVVLEAEVKGCCWMRKPGWPRLRRKPSGTDSSWHVVPNPQVCAAVGYHAGQQAFGFTMFYMFHIIYKHIYKHLFS